MSSRILLLSAMTAGIGSSQAVSDVVISYSPKEMTISVGEPVMIEVAIRNQFPQSLTVDLGTNRTEGFAVSISREDGRVLARDVRVGLASRSPYSVIPGGVTETPRFDLDAGETYRKRLLLNDWYRFAEPGAFHVDLDLTTPILTADGSPAIVAGRSGRMSVQVDPYDAGRLSKRCAALYKGIETAGDGQHALDLAYALAAIEDPIAVPTSTEPLCVTWARTA